MAAIPSVPFPRGHDDGASEQLLPAGALLGDDRRYRIDEIVAIGGMATVYKATDLRLKSACAVKALFLPAAEDETEARAFEAEAKLLASLHHPGIVGVRDYFADGEFAFLVMDFVDGQNLYDRHRRTGRFGEDTENLPISPVPEDQVALYASALAAALDYLHTRVPAVLYRDMKPHNVMRRASDGAVVLLDFGIAQRLRKRGKTCFSDDLGTPGYAAPEQYTSGSVLDARTDIYSLGVVLIELATGYNPRADDAPRFVPPVDSLGGGLSPAFRAILQKCSEHDPNSRYQSAAELTAALDAWRQTPRAIRRKSAPRPAWTFTPEGAPTGPLQSRDGIVYLADASGHAYALDAAAGHVIAEADAAPLPDELADSGTIRYALTASPAGWDAPAGMLAHTANAAGGGACATVFVDSLSPQWRLVAPEGRLRAAWCVAGARLAVAATAPAEVACVGRDARREWGYIWRVKLPDAPVALTGAADGGVYVLDVRSALYRIAHTGELLWRQTIPSRMAMSPRRLHDFVEMVCVYGGAAEGEPLVMLDALDGNTAWQAPGLGRLLSAPLATVDGEALIVPTRDAGLKVVHAADGSIARSFDGFPRPLAGAEHLTPASDVVALTEYGTGARVLLYDTARRREVWSDALSESGALAPPVVTAEAVVVQESSGRVRAWRWEDNR